MKILWITNTIFPDPSKAMGLPVPVIGGWMYGMAKQIACQENIDLAIASVYSGKVLREDTINGIIYFTIPTKGNRKYSLQLEPYWKKVCAGFKPDIIHIHGTEYIFGLACVRACPDIKYVISIQGMPGPISRYINGGIKSFDIIKNITFRDIIKSDNLFQKRKRVILMGSFENEYIQNCSTVIGRTSWDYSHVKSIFRHANYAFCNESLRDEFYIAQKWDINHITKHTIFLSQAGVPLKGLHKLLEACFLLKNEFPDLKIRIAGNNLVSNTSLKDKLKRSGYGKYIISLLRKFELFQQVEFLGQLVATLMIKEYQTANVFVCPSSIENSSNSVGEAQLIGTPVIASYVGGIPDMVKEGETGLLYRFEEVEMLAENIRKLFNDSSLAINLSEKEIIVAEKRHNRNINVNTKSEI